ncbi:MAG: carboxypeptidase regulatory-like domain-containing protein [Gammaproteobacteria bacterium]|nr:carboxypeptidase regulatory-like domain-containing protein [Gammaproteobacteria bacterium]
MEINKQGRLRRVAPLQGPVVEWAQHRSQVGSPYTSYDIARLAAGLAAAAMVVTGAACAGSAAAQQRALPEDDSPSGRGRKVSGVVVDAETDQPIARADVKYEDGGTVQTTTTDSKGYFEFGEGHSGVATVDAAGYATNYARWPPVQNRSQIRVLMRPPVPFGGTVYDMATRRPIEGAFVLVTVWSMDGVVTSGATETGSGGAYDFAKLLPVDATSRAVYVAHAEENYAPAIGTVALGKGGNRNVGIGLLLEARASGRVVDRDGAVVEGATVVTRYGGDSSYQTLEGYIGGDTLTGADGTFNVGGVVPDATITLQAVLGDGSTSGSVTATIGPGMVQSGIELRFP